MSADAASSTNGPTASGPWKLAILATTTEQQESKPFTLYVISVHYTVPEQLLRAGEAAVIDWTVSHRYSDFEALRAKLSEFSTSVPALPGKSWFGSLSADLVAQRKAGLHVFLQECLCRQWVRELAEWRDFLRIPVQVPSRLVYEWQPTIIKKVQNLSAAGTSETYGVTDAVYLPGPLVLLLGLEEQRLLQKVDNIVSQIRMPWEKKVVLARPLPLGAVKVHRVDPTTGAFKTMCSVATESGVSCLAWASETRTLHAGMDDGSVHVFRVDGAWQDLEPVRELRNLHESKSRVTALHLHSRKQYLLSTSRDKHLAIYDLAKDLVLSTTLVGGSVGATAWISSLEVDEDSDLSFIGTFAAHIHIFDIATPTNPRLLHTLEGHTGSVRCLQYRAQERYLFSGGFDGHAAIWSIGPGAVQPTPDSVLRSRSVGWLKEAANEKIKSICFLPARPGSSGDSGDDDGSQGLVAVGQDGGYLSFFNVTTGRMRYALKAHTSSVVKLLYVEDAGILISASLDGAVKFINVPAAASTGAAEGENAGNTSGVEEALAGASLGDVSASSSSSSSSVSASAASPSGQHSRRKSSSLGPSAPPPSMAPGNSVLHKSSRADSTDGITFSSSFADAASGTSVESRHSTRTSFFQEDDSADVSASTPSATSVPFNSSPSTQGRGRKESAAVSSSMAATAIPESDEPGGAVEVPTTQEEESDTGRQHWADIF